MKRTVSTLALGALCLPLFTADVVGQSLGTVRVANGFSRPVWIGSPPGDKDRLFIVEQQQGRVQILKNGKRLGTPFLNIRAKINASGNERGFLGMCFHPDYANNGFFYVNYTRAGNGATIVERYTVSSTNPDRANPGSATIIIGPISQPFSNHNAGDIKFGPDGYMYIPLGDGGSANDPQCRAQNLRQHLGKILRIDVDGGSPYAIPADNPVFTLPAFAEALPEIWARGLRNPWRFSFDRLTGDMYIGDVGQNAREEVDFQPVSSTGGENYGWKIMEANRCNSTSNCTGVVRPCGHNSYTDPIREYNLGGSPRNCTVVGGHVYRGCEIPTLRGTYFYADHCSNRIWSFRYDGTTLTEFTNRTAELRPPSGQGTIGSISSFGEDDDGEIYICDLFGGEIFKIVDDGPSAVTNLMFGTPGGNGQEPYFTVEGGVTSGTTSTWSLCDAAPNAAAVLVVGLNNLPTAIVGIGTLVPVPPIIAAPLLTDANGQFDFPVRHPGAALTLYGQVGVLDLGAAGGIALSNANQIDYQ